MSPQDPAVLPFKIGISPEPREIHVSAGAAPEVVAERLAIAARNENSDVKLNDTRRERDRKRGDANRRLVLLGGGDGPLPGQVEDVVLAGLPSGKTFDGPSMIVGSNGQPIAPPGETPELVDIRGETLNSLTWDTFLAWRKTKCRPFDRKHLSQDDPKHGLPDKYRLLEEIDQATLELIGEVAELGELFAENGPTAFWGNLRDKLIDEIGDIFFCAAWALDAWGQNPLYGADDLEMMRVAQDSELAAFANVIAANQMAVVLGNQRFVSMLGGLIFNLMLTIQTNAGLTANAFKKVKYQRREQDVEKQVGRIANVLIAVNQILIIANSSVEEALKVNMRKLDARYPNGYQPGQGGGNRTGEGK